MKNTIKSIPAKSPSLLPVATGETLKIFEVSGSPGMAMPLHYSTDEAVVNVKEGESKIIFEDKDLLLSVGDAFLIPAGKVHSLVILKEFKAQVVMPVNSDIKFSSENETYSHDGSI